MTENGTVYLTGAGPGGAGLITVRAKELIQIADVVVYDRLVGDEILELIPDRAKRVDVGKNSGRHPVPQEEIGKILLREARAHKTVVRLKGGDPCVFGRGGEEAEYLADNNVKFEIVPGVTSAVAAAAYAGIPVTHRDFASSLHIITGHGKSGKTTEINYGALAKLGGTMVFVMTVASAPAIAAGLIGAGMDENTPAAVIENGTMANQRSFTGGIGKLPHIMRRENIRSPAVIVVGEVCGLKGKLDWYYRRPLLGCRLLVTRPQNVAAQFGERLRALGADVMFYPCIRTSPLEFEIRLEGIDWAIFTSAAGVNEFFGRLEKSGRDARALAGISVAAVGARTAEALKKSGIRADFIPEVFDGEHLGQGLADSGKIKPGQSAALFRASSGGEGIIEILRGAGVIIDDIPVYETLPAAADPVNPEGFDYVTFTSASSVKGFVRINDPEKFTKIPAVCIGKQTAAAAIATGFNAIVSDKADISSMTLKIVEAYGQQAFR